jgi:radical SAM protein with 4Fe4S-binding SPASM domain
MSLLPSDYASLRDALTFAAAAVRQPLDGAFEITSRCNLQCGMCYIRPVIGDERMYGADRREELSAGQWVAIGRDAVESGMVFLLLTGGEPLLRPDFFDIYEPLRTLGLNITLFTNGTLITPEIASRLAAQPPNRLEITLYGASEATYQGMTGVPGAYSRCMSGIEDLRKAAVPLTLKTTLTKYNIGDLEAMKLMAREWGLIFSTAWMITPRRDGRAFPIDRYRLPMDCVMTLEAADRETRGSAVRGHKPIQTPSSTNAFPCGAGTTSFVVNSAGEMNICMDLPYPAARPLECGFQRAWDAVKQYADSVAPAGKCLSCELGPYCSTCPGYAWLESKDTGAPVPYLCELAAHRRGVQR